MATSSRLSVAARNAAANAVTALIGGGGKLKIYSGVQPTNPDTALGSQVKLAELAMNPTAFAAAVNGVATANAITADASADATGTATWFSITTSADVRIIEGSVDTAGANLILGNTAIVAGGNVAVASLTYTQVLEAD